MRASTALLALAVLAMPAALPAAAGPDATYADGRGGPAGDALDRLLSREGDEAAARAPDDADETPDAVDPLAPQDCRLLVAETVRPA